MKTNNYEEVVKEIKEDFISVFKDTKPADWKKAERNIVKLYKIVKMKTPIFVRVSNPREMKILISFLMLDGQDRDKKDNKYIEKCIDTGERIDFSKLKYQDTGDFSISEHLSMNNIPWIAKYMAFFRLSSTTPDKKDIDQIKTYDNIVRSCFGWYACEGVCIICDRPHTWTTVNEPDPHYHIEFTNGFSVDCEIIS